MRSLKLAVSLLNLLLNMAAVSAIFSFELKPFFSALNESINLLTVAKPFSIEEVSAIFNFRFNLVFRLMIESKNR